MAKGLADLAASLLQGGENFITKFIQEKIEDLGREVIAEAVGAVLPGAAVAQRITQAIATGGESEFNRLRGQWLSAITPRPLPGVGKITRAYDQAYWQEQRRQRTPWGRSDWAESRQDWLDNKWRHDWRSQPRDPATGRWVPGRLDHIAPELQTSGKHVGRTVRRWRALRRKRRAAARRAVRDAFDED